MSTTSSLSPGGITTTAFPLIASLCPPAVAVAAASGDVKSTMYSSGWPLRVERVSRRDVREHDAQRLAAHVPRLRARGRDVVRREVTELEVLRRICATRGSFHGARASEL